MRKVAYELSPNKTGFLSAADYPVVMSVGKETNISDLGPIPGNFMVYNFVPSQLESLKKASLFITHGGVSGMSEG